MGSDGERHATDRDLRAILKIQAIRAYLYGLGSVVIGASLANGGLSPIAVGWVFTAMRASLDHSSVNR